MFCGQMFLSSVNKTTLWFYFVNRKLEVQLPRFLLQRSYSLKDVLQTLNITQVFQDDADISNMGGAKGPKLNQVSRRKRLQLCVERHRHRSPSAPRPEQRFPPEDTWTCQTCLRERRRQQTSFILVLGLKQDVKQRLKSSLFTLSPSPGRQDPTSLQSSQSSPCPLVFLSCSL